MATQNSSRKFSTMALYIATKIANSVAPLENIYKVVHKILT